jgi:hypothetical protein
MIDKNYIKIEQKDWQLVKKNIVKKLLELPDGRFPTERINNLSDIMFKTNQKEQAKMHSLSNEGNFNCDNCG